jgi:UDP-N-acetylmuramoyl-tripeptide--D-alanyl-D-alanine ligase
MIPVELGAIAGVLGARTVEPHGNGASGRLATTVRAVMTDTRIASAEPALFFALRTATADGHDHVASAATAGAVAAVVERETPGAALTQLVVDDAWVALSRIGRHVVDEVGCRVVAITGSYGKTTVKDLTAAALSAERRVTASHASFNNELGVPLTMLSVGIGTEVLVAEAGARSAGDLTSMGALLGPDVSVITTVGPVHLETFGDEDGVAAEKSRLVAALGPAGTAVLNADDPRVLAMSRLASSAVTVSASGARADVWAEDVTLDAAGRVRAVLRSPWGSADVAVPIPGRHHLTNALLAIAVAGVEGVRIEAAAAAVAAAGTSPSRSVITSVAGVTILDDAYNASPPTMLGALDTLLALPCTGRRWAVLGLMAELGPSSGEQHRAIGRAFAGQVDELVLVGKAADEGMLAGAAEAATAGTGQANVRLATDHADAAAVVLGDVRAGDTVLFKGSRVATLDRAASGVLAGLGGGTTQ